MWQGGWSSFETDFNCLLDQVGIENFSFLKTYIYTKKLLYLVTSAEE